MEVRTSSRAVIINRQNRVLLFKFSFHDINDSINKAIKEFWVTPGGGLKDRESFQDALKREVHEETGIVIQAKPIWIWTRNVKLEWKEREFISYERYYLVHTNISNIDIVNMTENEANTLKHYQWWSINDIENSHEEFRPPEIAKELQLILTETDQVYPIEIT